jgi:hypothetical protein
MESSEKFQTTPLFYRSTFWFRASHPDVCTPDEAGLDIVRKDNVGRRSA